MGVSMYIAINKKIGETCEAKEYLRSIDSFFVTNQACILII